MSLRSTPFFPLILLNEFFLPCTSCSSILVRFGFIVYLVALLLCSSGEFSGALVTPVPNSSVACSTHRLFSTSTPRRFSLPKPVSGVGSWTSLVSLHFRCSIQKRLHLLQDLLPAGQPYCIKKFYSFLKWSPIRFVQ